MRHDKSQISEIGHFCWRSQFVSMSFQIYHKKWGRFFCTKRQHQASFNWPPDPLSFLLCLYVYIVLCLLTRPTAEEYISYFTCEDCSFLLLIFYTLNDYLKTFTYELKSIEMLYLMNENTWVVKCWICIMEQLKCYF